MNKKIENSEIDLIEVLISLWNHKSKITFITIVFIILSIILHFVIKPPINAKTEILPITIFENNLYSPYNLLVNTETEGDDKNILNEQRLNKINSNYLLDLFLEELETKEIIIKAIKNYKLLDKKKFKNEYKYLEAIERKALKLNLLRPINVDGSKLGEIRLNWMIEFKIKDKEKWEGALNFIESEINNNIQKYLQENFNSTLNNLKLLDQFKLEDLALKIQNVKNDYITETSNRLAFLREQALIARKLNIKNNTLEVENFSTPSGVISNLQSAKPYYMRGYSMIEKEIELIETRTNKDAFTKNLFDLEKQRRDLLQNKSLERIEELFNNTPILSNNNFKAANIIYKDTEYEPLFSLIKTIFISGIFGILFGTFYILILNAIRLRR